MSTDNIRILNIDIHNWIFRDFVENLTEGFVVTPNVDHLIKLQKDKAFYEAYASAEHIVCDSKILILLSKILNYKNPVKEQIAGSDLFPAFCNHYAEIGSDTKIFLLGGSENSVLQAKDNINTRTRSTIVIDGYSPPFGFEKNEDENNKIVNLVNNSEANVLAVGVGAPKQELWIVNNRDKLKNIRIFMAIGATIEFEAGALNRAPKWMTKFGVEWLYRLAQEPGRLFKRYILEDIPIFVLILKQKFNLYKNPWD